MSICLRCEKNHNNFCTIKTAAEQGANDVRSCVFFEQRKKNPVRVYQPDIFYLTFKELNEAGYVFNPERPQVNIVV